MRERNDLSNVAIKVNGVYLEDAVAGYETFAVYGRETLPKELAVETTFSNGSTVKNTRYPAREIKVEYLLRAPDYDTFQTRFETLMKYLAAENATVIFNGEYDKYFTGTFYASDAPEYKKIFWKGEYIIYCADPFKYFITEKVLSSSSSYWDGSNWNFSYNGTAECFPKFVTTFPATYNANGEQTDTSEYGYFGFANSAGKVLQFGNPNETDYVDIQYKTMRLLNHKFSAWGNFSHDAGISLSGGHAYPTSYSGADTWRPTSMNCIIPTEPGGTEGATNFSATVKHKFVGTKKQFGGFQFQIIDTTDNSIIGRAIVRKTSKDDKCAVYAYVGATQVKNWTRIKVSSIGTTTITKEGGKVTISCGGKSASLTPTGMAAKKGYKVNIIFERYKSTTVLGTNYVTDITFNKNNDQYVKDLENTFQPGDIITVDCKDGSILRGSSPEPSLGALGNDWETFTLVPGNNIIATDYLGWDGSSSPTPPEFVLSYRERFI